MKTPCYAPNFEEVEGAYWLDLVHLSVLPNVHLSVKPFVGSNTREELLDSQDAEIEKGPIFRV